MIFDKSDTTARAVEKKLVKHLNSSPILSGSCCSICCFFLQCFVLFHFAIALFMHRFMSSYYHSVIFTLFSIH